MDEPTRATDAVLVLFNALTDREQDEVRDRINELKLRELAEGSSPAARSLRSLRRVAEQVGHTPSTAEYRQLSEQLQAAGEDIEPFARVYAQYGSWPRAREALSLSETSSVTAIEAASSTGDLGSRGATAKRSCARH